MKQQIFPLSGDEEEQRQWFSTVVSPPADNNADFDLMGQRKDPEHFTDGADWSIYCTVT